MAKKKLLTSVALSLGLLVGGAAGVILGVPGVSGAQTTTVPDSPSTTTPGGPQTAPDQAPADDRNCPDKAGKAPAGTTTSPAPAAAATNASVGRGAVGSV